MTLGLCCMASKASSSPMQAILRRLELCRDFQIVIFPEKTILEEPIEQWPKVKCLIAFASNGFPLEKCVEYVNLVNPVLVNNIEAQAKLQSRVSVYRTLSEWGIPCPEHVVINHVFDASLPQSELTENENYILYRGRKITKPFVEKPDDGDRHDIWIYYPMSVGGGTKKLFRKVKDRSSEFDMNQNCIRRDGTYIYEPFLPTQGTDIKVYTVGAGYVHAEARKAPTVDGKVERSKDGKECRLPVVLTQAEKAISALIVKAFKQYVCGFDILRTDGGSYVCDVNGWSFVKGNQKYYNDCSTLMRQRLLEESGYTDVDINMMMILGPGDEVIKDHASKWSQDEGSCIDGLPENGGTKERLRSVLVVMRHGDRRPKEKMKFKSKQPALLAYFDRQEGNDADEEAYAEVKLKTPEEMATLKRSMENALSDLKAQMASSRELEITSPGGNDKRSEAERKEELKDEIQNIENLIEMLAMEDRFSAFERKVQLKPSKWKPVPDGSRKLYQVLVVAKWGGELTLAGMNRAEVLGRNLRLHLYPQDPTGLLRLHSSFRHDFKIYSSQEGRCQITAAAFTRGFLALEGDITPILAALVSCDQYAQALLDAPIPRKERDMVKNKIESLLMSLKDMSSEEMIGHACPTEHVGLRDAAVRIGSPLKLLKRIHQLIQDYIDAIVKAKDRAHAECHCHEGEDNAHLENEDAVPIGAAPNPNRAGNGTPLSPQSSTGVWSIPEGLADAAKKRWLHLRRKADRWNKLFNGFAQPDSDVSSPDDKKDEAGFKFDMSKIPDVWDNVYYDLLVHRDYLGEEPCRIAEEMVEVLQPLNEWVCLSEYGISQEEKLRIGTDVTWRLLAKIVEDLEFMIQDDLDEAGKRKDADFEEESCSSEPAFLAAKSVDMATQSQSLGVAMGNPSGTSGTDAGASRATSDSPQRQVSEAVEDPSSEAFPQRAKAFTSGSGLFAPGPRTTLETTDEGPPPPPPDMGTGVRRVRSAEYPTLCMGTSTIDNVAQRPWLDERRETPDIPLPIRGVGLDARSSSKRTKLTRLTPELRQMLKKAVRDASDWHPRLNEEVAKLTGIRNTKIVRSRIYVTSASTMHSLFNILRHGHTVSGDKIIDPVIDGVIDLNYLTHVVFRCYEREDDGSQATAQGNAGTGDGSNSSRHSWNNSFRRQEAMSKYRVEIAISPGVQVFDKKVDAGVGPEARPVQWPSGDEWTEKKVAVAPLRVIAHSAELATVERMLNAVLHRYGGHSKLDGEDEEKPSDN